MRCANLTGLGSTFADSTTRFSRGDVLKANGEPYLNTAGDWQWLQDKGAKAARFLGYVPFTSIADERNDPPIINRQKMPRPEAYLNISVKVTIPQAEDLEPDIGVWGFEGRQPYHLVIFGEKSSLADILEPIAKRRQADLFLPTGEISSTLVYQMAADNAEDGRPLRVFTISDHDPAGHQMPISIARKLQALRDLDFPEMDFEVRPIALLPEHVKLYGLPSTPLKETERRADRWREAFGTEQTEVDALATLQPSAFRQLVVEAIDPFFDAGLAQRVWQARDDWEERAKEKVEGYLDSDTLDALRAEAAEKLAGIKEEIDRLNEAMRAAVPENIPLPDFDIPEPEVDESLHGKPLISSEWGWAEQTTRLISHRAYANGEAGR